MALSEYERQMLADLESQLTGEDAGLGDVSVEEYATPMTWALSAKNLILGLIVAMLGLAVVLIGVAIEWVSVGVLGVIVVFLGFWYVSAGITKKPGAGGGSAHRPNPKRGDQSDFMQRQVAQWVRRMQDGNRN